MTVSAFHLTTDSSSANGTAYTTASISPNPNRLLLCAVAVSVSTAPTPAVTVTGCGVTWVQVTANASGTQPLQSRTLYLFRAMGTPTAGALTISGASEITGAIWQVVEFSGVDTSGTNGSGAVVQSVNHRTDGTDVTSVSQAFGSTITSGNAAYAAVALHSQQVALTAGTGWTIQGQATVTGPQTSMMGESAIPAVQNVAASWATAGDAFLVGVEIKAAAGDTTPPSVPASIAVVADGPRQVTVSWSASTDNVAVASYRVRRGGVDLASGVTGTSYVDTTVQPRTAYSYTVSAVDATGNRSAESAAGNITTPVGSRRIERWTGTVMVPVVVSVWDGTALIQVDLDGTGDIGDTTPPTTPAGVAATAASPTAVTLSWTASTDDVGVDGYRVRRGGTIVGETTGTTYSDTTVSPSSSYSYTVQAFDEAGNDSPQSSPVSVSTPAPTDTTPPSVPTGLTATAVSSNRIDLSWSVSTDNVQVDHYVVLRSGNVIAPRVTGTAYSVIGLAASTSYSFTVQAVDTSGNTSAESAAASATTQADVPPPPPTPVGEFVIGLTAAQIQSAPQSGPEWVNLKRQADAAYTFLPGDGNTDGSGNAFAGALYYIATGDTNYRAKVLTAVQKVEATPPGDWWHAGRNRKLGGWALAAHLIGHETTSWHNYLQNMLTQVNGGPGRSSVMHACAHDWDNNHGGAAMSSYVPICAILGLTQSNVTIGGTPGGVYHANKWLRGWLGDHSSATGYGHIRSTNPPYGSLGVTDLPYSDSWQENPNVPYGVVSTSAPGNKPGAVPADVTRDGATYPDIGASAKHYVYGNAGRRTMAAVVLAAMGYPDIWTVGDHALYRWRKWCADNTMPPEGANNQVYDPVISKVYGRKYNTAAFTATSQQSEIMTATEWLALIPGWPVRPSSLA